MTWIKFAIWLLGSYIVYYAAIIFWDRLRNNQADTHNEKHELTFVEDVIPVKSHLEEKVPDGKESSLFSSGGVSLKQMFNLAREEVVEYTRAVSF